MYRARVTLCVLFSIWIGLSTCAMEVSAQANILRSSIGKMTKRTNLEKSSKNWKSLKMREQAMVRVVVYDYPNPRPEDVCNPEGKPGAFYSTGFVVKDVEGYYIVTSMHVMSHQYACVYYNVAPSVSMAAKLRRYSKILDLALLELVVPKEETKKAAMQAAIPLQGTAYYKLNPREGAELVTLGYREGSKILERLTTKLLDKNQNLSALLNSYEGLQDVKVQIEDAGMPVLSRKVYKFESCGLKPGYSGAPVFNDEGELVAIGNGGILRDETCLFTWGIPFMIGTREDSTVISHMKRYGGTRYPCRGNAVYPCRGEVIKELFSTKGKSHHE